MKIIKLNLRNLFKENTVFSVMIIITIAIGCFSILFSMGVLFNNKCVSMEDALTTKRVYVGFDEDVLWEDSYDAFYDICRVFENSVYEFTINGSEQKGPDDIFWTYCSFSDFEDGKFVTGPTIDKIISYQIMSGRNLCNEDYTDNKNVAISVGGNVGDEITFGGKSYEVVGTRSADGMMGNIVILPITAWGNNMVSSINLDLELIPSYSQYKAVMKILDENFAGNYRISDFRVDDNDVKAVYKTIGLVAAGIIVVILVTIFYLMGYVYDNRSYQTAVFRLMGCKSMRAVGYFVCEALILAVFSGLLGTGLFAVCRKAFFDKYYRYMEGLFDFKVYAGVIAGVAAIVLLEIFLMSIKIIYKPVKNELREVQ